jgi:hypothetical protein
MLAEQVAKAIGSGSGHITIATIRRRRITSEVQADF